MEALKRLLHRKCHIQAQETSIQERAAHQSVTLRETNSITLQLKQSRVLAYQVLRTVNVPLVVRQDHRSYLRELETDDDPTAYEAVYDGKTSLTKIRNIMG